MRRKFDRLALLIIMPLLAACGRSAKTENRASSPAVTQKIISSDESCTIDVSPAQQSVIDRVMGNHGHRLYHFLWHATRNSWASLNRGERKIIQSIDPEWGKNAPLCPADRKYSGEADVAGEEFLLMHHKMVAHLQSALAKQALPCIQAWKTIPEKNDAHFPVPKVEGDDSKTDETGVRLRSWEAKFRDPTFLKGKSLSYVGMMIESSIHNTMHMRWADAPKKGDDFAPTDQSFTVKTLLDDSPYDGPEFHWLGNPYSAHLNPVFWKLHGWVDDTVRAWVEANGYESISEKCDATPKCYQWKAKWIGGSMFDKDRTNHPPTPGSPGTKGPPGSGSDPLEAVLKKIAAKAGFGTPKIKPRASSATPKGIQGGTLADLALADPTMDPVALLEQYGPSSKK
jgi:hypothetical protein